MLSVVVVAVMMISSRGGARWGLGRAIGVDLRHTTLLNDPRRRMAGATGASTIGRQCLNSITLRPLVNISLRGSGPDAQVDRPDFADGPDPPGTKLRLTKRHHVPIFRGT
jgi:hypothetical protein